MEKYRNICISFANVSIFILLLIVIKCLKYHIDEKDSVSATRIIGI